MNKLFAPPTKEELASQKDLFAAPTEDEYMAIATQMADKGQKKYSEVESGLRGASDMATYGNDDELTGGIGAVKDLVTHGDLDLIDNYKHYRDVARDIKREAQAQNPKSYLAGQVFGGIGSNAIMPVGNMVKGAGLSKAVVTGAIEGGLYGAGSAKEKKDIPEEVVKGAGIGGAAGAFGYGANKVISAGLDKAQVVSDYLKGKFAKVIPGAEGASEAVNRATAKLGSIMPYQDASEKELYDVLSNPQLRQQARNTNLLEETKGVLPKLNDAFDSAENAVSNSYQSLEKSSLAPKGIDEAVSDVEALEDTISKKLYPIIGKINEVEGFYGTKSSKLADQTVKILQGFSPDEVGPTRGKTLREVLDIFSNEGNPQNISETVKRRVLDARRNLDDFMKNKNWESLSKYEKEAISEIRNSLDEPLKSIFSGSEDRVKADSLYSGFKNTIDDLKEFTTKRGDIESGIEKTYNSLRSGSARGVEFDSRIKAFDDFIKQNEKELGQIPEVQTAMDEIKKLRDIGSMDKMLNELNRAGGGPTSQIINNITQIVAGIKSGGYSALAMPITNPAGWMRIVDALSGYPAMQPLLMAIENSAKAIMTQSPKVATGLYILNKKNPEVDK